MTAIVKQRRILLKEWFVNEDARREEVVTQVGRVPIHPPPTIEIAYRVANATHPIARRHDTSPLEPKKGNNIHPKRNTKLERSRGQNQASPTPFFRPSNKKDCLLHEPRNRASSRGALGCTACCQASTPTPPTTRRETGILRQSATTPPRTRVSSPERRA